MADGPSIELTSGRALANGQDMEKHCLWSDSENKMIYSIVLMGYYNPIYAYGREKFSNDAVAAGVDGLIMVDLPPEEEEEYRPFGAAAGIDIVRLIAPTSTDHRIATLVENASGFVYYVSVRGITGTTSAAKRDIVSNVGRIRAHTDLPIAVGFGIRTPQQAAEVAAIADAAVVGTAIVEKIANKLDAQGNPSRGMVKKHWTLSPTSQVQFAAQGTGPYRELDK